jgi:hypothetical protein
VQLTRPRLEVGICTKRQSMGKCYKESVKKRKEQ